MRWEDIADTVDAWTELAADPAWIVKLAAADVPTIGAVGYYYHPVQDQIALFAEKATETDLALCKAAAERVVGPMVRPLSLSYQELSDPEGQWIKVAYSPTLRRLGELTNFFPGQYPGGVPNAPSPVAAMLTSGLLGAGLGWGAGRLAHALLPSRFGKKLSRTGAIAGALLGAAPGAAWGAMNYGAGLPFNDPSALDIPREALPENVNFDLGHEIHPTSPLKLAEDQIKQAFGEAFGQPYEPKAPSPLDVNIDSVGRTLWDTGASPQLASTTMSALYAAQQMPSPSSQPGWATGDQLGRLAASTAGDYMKGLLVGAALNAVVGTPYKATTFGMGNAALGIIGAAIPKLFGG